jgi:hypothetical protein
LQRKKNRFGIKNLPVNKPFAIDQLTLNSNLNMLCIHPFFGGTEGYGLRILYAAERMGTDYGSFMRRNACLPQAGMYACLPYLIDELNGCTDDKAN